MASWDELVDSTLATLAGKNLLFMQRLITLPPPVPPSRTFAGPGPWDRPTVEIRLDGASTQEWLALNGLVSEEGDEVDRKVVLFSGNDYIGLATHPAVLEAAAKAAQGPGMGPRSSSLIFGYTTYHKLAEESLADLLKMEDCLLCPTGYAANTSVMSAIGSIISLSATGRNAAQDERIAIFSDAWNHASIIDGIRLAERQQEAVAFVYKHCDMSHLESLLSGCSMAKKVVVTDSLFSMDGDFAPLPELVKLRSKYGFLLVVDDAHGTFLCGENGGGIPEMFGCEDGIDICVGSLSKGGGCQGGFIACSIRWKKLIISRGRPFMFSSALPLPIIASLLAAIHVSKKEGWRRSLVWDHVKYFASLTKLNITSPIIPIIVGTEEAVLKAHRHLHRSGFLVIPIRPPVVPANSCRLRVSLSSAHTSDDIKRLVDALSPWLPTCASASRL
ncbi:hypothetical protein CFC21_009200 [Triticum aestivum]|uniref:serine C-palmitoyltransferase n=2 Tax=Triticum aestivum TaxID=4565 RepID=A0A3B5Z4S2_WHEAT|nr:8-amino-7-oxononanoate synthase-like [Triticum aestivum]KAF6992184.1 hypothetical protein CFC21_009200 [Triticum aestivum]